MRTKAESEARSGEGVARDTLDRLEKGLITMPPEADPKTFIMSEGRTATATVEQERQTLKQVCDRLVEGSQNEESTQLTTRIHVGRLTRLLGGQTEVDRMTRSHVQTYRDHRAKEQWNGRGISADTIQREVKTLRIADSITSRSHDWLETAR